MLYLTVLLAIVKNGFLIVSLLPDEHEVQVKQNAMHRFLLSKEQ